jgi:hypothetical protein
MCGMRICAFGGVNVINLAVIAKEIGRLRAQLFATFSAARVQDLATCFCGHACAKAVTVLTNAIRWLKGAFHRSVLQLSRAVRRFACPMYLEARPIEGRGG